MSTPDQRTGLGRRALLQAAIATPVVAAAPIVMGPSAAVARTPRQGSFDAVHPRFALAVLPDTQYLFDADSSDPAPLTETFRYLLQEREESNIAFMTHLGDVTEHGTEDEIARADLTFRPLDGRFPYSVLAGNHDVRGSTNDQRGDTPYLRAFGPQRFVKDPTFGGSSPDGYNSYHVITAAGRSWLILAMDWRASDAGFAWAQRVLDSHRRLPTVLTTHELAYSDGDGVAQLSGYGQVIWDRLIRRNDQIFLTLNGHYWPPGRTVLKNDAGNDVHVHITNYQDRYYGGAGMIRLYNFDLARQVIDVETFSPWFLATDPAKRNELAAETIELSGDVDRFTLEIDFAERFSSFAPVPEPAPRPAATLVSRSTVAYWRFDDAGMRSGGTPGQPVAAGSVVRDLSGRGNDLTVRLLNGSGPDVLTWSDDHDRGQPAHASLLFGGGQNPDRGAVLESGPKAPVNSVTLESGYTIEAFIKLPEPFVGNHGFMGIWSWEGRAAEAGKTNGYSPQNESPISLNLSSERFIQYNVYPARQNASPTSWSHAVPTGRWMHVAVVNDGDSTIVFVDGSKIVRNPTQPSTGLATVGKPFAIGGTQWAGNFGQGFYGWVGDLRITAKALRPQEFLTPFLPGQSPIG